MQIMVIKYGGEKSLHECDYFELRKNRVDANLLIVHGNKKEVLDNVAVIKSVKTESNDKMPIDEAIDLLNKLYLKADFTDEYGDMEDTEPYEEAIKMVAELLKQEPCEDCISRQVVLEVQIKYAEHMGATKYWQMRDDIRALSPVTPQPKIGHWLRMSDLSEQEDDRYKCSRCGNVVHYTNKMSLYTFNSWCGRCGSDNSRK